MVGEAETEEVKEFLARADAICRAVKAVVHDKTKLLDGEAQSEISRAAEVAATEKRRQTLAQIRKREDQERERDRQTYGKTGKGEHDGYDFFCRSCFTEYAGENNQSPAHISREHRCKRCGHWLMTKDQRHDELKGKTEQMMQRRARRERNGGGQVDSSSSEDDAAFQAGSASAELQSTVRAQSCEADTNCRVALKCKEKGNRCLGKGDYFGALEAYENAIQAKRDMKELYSNKALVELKLKRYSCCIQSATDAISLIETFDMKDGKVASLGTRTADILFKAFCRRAKSHRALRDWSKALTDVKQALEIHWDDVETLEMRNVLESVVSHRTTIDEASIDQLKSVQRLQTLCGKPQTVSNSAVTDIFASISEHEWHEAMVLIKSSWVATLWLFVPVEKASVALDFLVESFIHTSGKLISALPLDQPSSPQLLPVNRCCSTVEQRN
eukprot:GHVN01058945.1.p1 GENE.GHVN01058945.1~~GHVN01058945.1.p1  ORF type:complete len:444 (+),score=29.92 GHVN01058945.1:75-1406(+)